MHGKPASSSTRAATLNSKIKKNAAYHNGALLNLFNIKYWNNRSIFIGIIIIVIPSFLKREGYSATSTKLKKQIA